MLAYLFWHRPRDPAASVAYESAHVAFHRSLGHRPPVGFLGSAALRAAKPPFARSRLAGPGEQPDGEDADAGVYEDWYLVEDFAALGVLNEAAVGRGHRTAHDEVAHRTGAGAGGLYAFVEGRRPPPFEPCPMAVWLAGPPASTSFALGDLFADGIDPSQASLWRRQLVFGPGPEFCVLTPEAPVGVASTRLPAGWRASASTREVLWAG